MILSTFSKCQHFNSAIKRGKVKNHLAIYWVHFSYVWTPTFSWFHLGTSTRKNYCRVRGKRLWARKALALIWAFSLRHLFTLIEKQTAQIDQRVVLQLWRGGDPAERFKNWLGHSLPHFLFSWNRVNIADKKRLDEAQLSRYVPPEMRRRRRRWRSPFDSAIHNGEKTSLKL